MSKYTASIFGGQNIIFKPYIDISSNSVKFKVPGFLSGQEQTISIDSITEIGISGSIISKTITIHTTGLGSIVAEGFSPSDAKAIQREIESNRTKKHNKKQQRDVFDDTGDDDDDYYVQISQRSYQEPISSSEAKSREFTDIERIPLISFSHYPPQLFGDMNALLHYANEQLDVKDFESWHRKKVEAYIRKLDEGMRIADSLNLDTVYLKKEMDTICSSIEVLKQRMKSRTSSKWGWRLFKWLMFIMLVAYVWKRCR